MSDSDVWSRSPHCKSKNIYNGGRPITYIQMNRNALTKSFMMISNGKTLLSLRSIQKYPSTLRVKQCILFNWAEKLAIRLFKNLIACSSEQWICYNGVNEWITMSEVYGCQSLLSWLSLIKLSNLNHSLAVYMQIPGAHISNFYPFKPEFTIVIFIHYKPRIAVAIFDLQWMKMTWGRWKINKNCHVLEKQFHGNCHSKTPSCGKIKSVFGDVKWCFNASWGFKALNRLEVRHLF